MTDNKKSVLTKDIKEHIDNWNKRYPEEQKRSGILEALRVVQEHEGYLTEDAMVEVADYLNLPKIHVFEVATFYSMFFKKPVGKNVLDVCTNISCMLSDAEDILDHCKKKLKIDLNQTTSDGKFTLREVECLGACANAPVIQVGKKYYEDLTKEKVDSLIKELE